MAAPLIVLKVSGSLFDLPDLRQRLRAYLAGVQPARVLLFPGGGRMADTVRAWDQTHALGDEAAHWLAVQSLSLNAGFLGTLLAIEKVSGPVLEKGPDSFVRVLDPLAWFRADESHPDRCPHNWDVTSDSLSLRLAQSVSAARLDLLKSTPLPEEQVSGPLSEEGPDTFVCLAELGLIDRYFATQFQRAPLPVRWVNLRESM